MSTSLSLTLSYALAQFRSRPGQSLLAAGAIAIGVALALAIHLVNASALSEFSDALAKVDGQAQLRIEPRLGAGLDEQVYERLVAATLAGEAPLPVAALSPVIELQAEPVPETVSDAAPPQSAPQSLRVLGIDVFKAAQVSPALMPLPSQGGGSDSALFRNDSVFLSAAALQRLRLQPGDPLRLRYRGAIIELRIAGTVPGVSQDQPLAVMDIGAMQWRFGWLGRLSRIDLIWSDAAPADGGNGAARESALQGLIGSGARAVRPALEGQKISNLSRAYRVNLTVLSLVALLTGAYIVFTTMALSVARQRRGLAMLGILGLSQPQLSRVVLLQAGLLGVAGALLGTAAGIGIASVLLSTLGADLGSGYFRGLHPALHPDPLACALFALLGIAIALLGAWLPARAARGTPLAMALRGFGSSLGSERHVLRTSLAAVVLGAIALLLPPIRQLPIPAYLAIALWLVAGIGLSSLLASALGVALRRLEPGLAARVPMWLAANRFTAASAAGRASADAGSSSLQHGASAGTAIAGVVASFALASAMAIMVHSFRDSVAVWLDQVLPADLYVRVADADAANLRDPAWQASARALPGVRQIDFVRVRDIGVSADKAKATLLARPLDPGRIEQQLPLIGGAQRAAAGTTPVYVSEVAASLFALRVGDQIDLPDLASGTRFFVAAIWRDYARQNGALAIALDDYRRLTGDAAINEMAIWQQPGIGGDALVDSLKATLPPGTQLQWRSAAQLRALSLQIFDRSFVLTYVLEAIAILVGLLGVAASFASDAISRAREFAVLRYLGLRRVDLLGRIGAEASLSLLVAALAALALGVAIAAVLVFVINPQSFHWTMRMRLPWGLLAASSAGLVVCGIGAAMLGARSVMAPQLTQTLKADG